MTLVKRLTRGVARPSDLAAALDLLGVKPGEDFIVSRADDLEREHAPARRTDPDTSHRAAQDAAPRVGSQRHAALEALAKVYPGGLTYAEVEQATGINGVWKRLSELNDQGWVHTPTERVIPATGSMGAVYVLTEKGCALVGLTAPADPPAEPEYTPDSLLGEPMTFTPAAGPARNAINDDFD